jgi:hypothetical protein
MTGVEERDAHLFSMSMGITTRSSTVLDYEEIVLLQMDTFSMSMETRDAVSLKILGCTHSKREGMIDNFCGLNVLLFVCVCADFTVQNRSSKRY